jgi:hypothetical protein
MVLFLIQCLMALYLAINPDMLDMTAARSSAQECRAEPYHIV